MIEAARGRGRPRDLDKRRAILDAAGAIFHERGIAATTMEGVAERAGVSKMTVYAHFADKPALLSAVFEGNIAAMRLADLRERPDLASSLEELTDFGERLVAYLTQPDIVRSGGLLRAGAREHPQLAAAFYAAGPQAMVAKVAAFLDSLASRGFIVLDDPALAAEVLTTAWLGLSQLRQSLGVAGPPDAEEISRRVRLATGALLGAWAAKGA